MGLERICRPMAPPLRLAGKVVEGFKRGSKDLGWPTANLDPAVFESQLDEAEEGVYVGWARIEDDTLPPAARAVHKAVLSIGWNPFYKNEQRTLEAYLCHEFGRDFYGQPMRLLVCGFLRPQADFGSMDQLIAEITADVEYGQAALGAPPLDALAGDAFFAATMAATPQPESAL